MGGGGGGGGGRGDKIIILVRSCTDKSVATLFFLHTAHEPIFFLISSCCLSCYQCMDTFTVRGCFVLYKEVIFFHWQLYSNVL